MSPEAPAQQAPDGAAGAEVRVLIWDLPSRLMHWLLTVLVLLAFGLAATAEPGQHTFSLHMLCGLAAAFVAAVRVVWGLVGSRHARFRSFLFGPRALLDYLRAALRRSDARHVGHNPGSSYAILAMLLLTLGLGASGLAAVLGDEPWGEMHGPVAHLAMLVVAAHVAGVLWHTVRHRENIIWSMIDGKKQAAADQAIPRAHVLAALLVLVLAAAWGWALGRGYDAAQNELRLPLIGMTIPLGAPGRHPHR